MDNDPELYNDEKCERLFDYPRGFRFAPLDTQVDLLRRLGIQKEYPDPQLPRKMGYQLPPQSDGWALAPALNDFAVHDHNASLRPALDNLLELTRRDIVLRGVKIEDNLRKGLLRAKPHHYEKMRRAPVASGSLLFPAQLGMRFGDTCVSPRRAEVLFDENEFGLDVVTALVIVATHWSQLKGATMRIDCPGAEYSPGGDPEKCTDTPRIDIAHGVIALDWNWNQRARGLHGSASGWLVA